MSFKIKNIKIEGATKDSGWNVSSTGNCYTAWSRSIHTFRPPQEVAEELRKEGDYPGWTGVTYAPGLSREGYIVFTSIWDSSD